MLNVTHVKNDVKLDDKFLLTEIFFFPQKHLHGVLKRKKKMGGGRRKSIFSLLNFFSEGGILGCVGAPHAPTRGDARGRKTIHFFL